MAMLSIGNRNFSFTIIFWDLLHIYGLSLTETSLYGVLL